MEGSDVGIPENRNCESDPTALDMGYFCAVTSIIELKAVYLYLNKNKVTIDKKRFKNLHY